MNQENKSCRSCREYANIPKFELPHSTCHCECHQSSQPPIETDGANGMRERLVAFLIEWCPKNSIWWCDDNTRWNVLNNYDAEDELVDFLQSEKSLLHSQLLERVEKEKRLSTEITLSPLRNLTEKQREREMVEQTGYNNGLNKFKEIINQIFKDL